MALSFLIFVREPHLDAPHERGVEHQRIVRGENDLRATRVFRAKNEPQEFAHHQGMHGSFQLVDANDMAGLQDVQPRSRQRQQATCAGGFGVPRQGKVFVVCPPVQDFFLL